MPRGRAHGRAYQHRAVKFFEQLLKHPLTDRGLEGFLKDWEKGRETLGDLFEAAFARSPKR
jgi:hypothetical protein